MNRFVRIRGFAKRNHFSKTGFTIDNEAIAYSVVFSSQANLKISKWRSPEPVGCVDSIATFTGISLPSQEGPRTSGFHAVALSPVAGIISTDLSHNRPRRIEVPFGINLSC